MDDLLKAGLDWLEAKRKLHEALLDTEKYLKQKGKAFEVVDPLPFANLWTDLSKAESNLKDRIQFHSLE